jgi:hypothetical protein
MSPNISEGSCNLLIVQYVNSKRGLTLNLGSESLFIQTIWSLFSSLISIPAVLVSPLLTFSIDSVLGDLLTSSKVVTAFINFSDLIHFLNVKVLESDLFANPTFTSVSSRTEINASSKITNSLDLKDKIMYANEEISSNFRQQRFQNPVFRYNYKIGNYFPKVDKVTYPHLFTTISELTGGIRKSAWFFSDTFSELFETSFTTYLNFIFDHNVVTDKEIGFVPSYVNNTDGFYNFFLVLAENYTFINRR